MGTASNGVDQGDGNTGNNDGDQEGGLSQVDPKKIFTITNSALAFLSAAKNAAKSFYLQLSHYALHAPDEAQPGTISIFANQLLRPLGTKHDDPDFGAMTEDVDEGLGLLLDALDSMGLSSNIYLVYMSDNGSSQGISSNQPLSNGKTYICEGGIQVPLIVLGPGHRCQFPEQHSRCWL